MTQYARPDSDVDNQSDAWTNSDGGAPENTLYTYINGTVPCPGDPPVCNYVAGSDDECSGEGVYFTVELPEVDDPESSSSHAMKFYGRVESAESDLWTKIELMKDVGGAEEAVIATKTISDPDDTSAPGTLYTHNLSTSEANDIDDYTDLSLRIYFGDDGCMGVNFQVYQAWFECPDAPTPSATTSPAFLLFVD